MIRGRALDTTVLDSIATNIASRSPLSASSTSRCDIWPARSTGAAVEDGGGGGLLGHGGCSIHDRHKVDVGNYIPCRLLDSATLGEVGCVTPRPAPNVQRPAGVALVGLHRWMKPVACGSGDCLWIRQQRLHGTRR